MRLVVLDTETTGLSETDQVVELAAVDVTVRTARKKEIVSGMRSWSTLVKPTCPVSIEARATHHITDEELVDAPDVEQLRGRLGDEWAGDVMVAHNLDFDERMLRQSGFGTLPERKICTWRCALHKYPDSPRHSNQALRYYLGIDAPRVRGLPPHRALPDALVTAALLLQMLEISSVQELEELTAQPALLRKVTFGKYRGQLWSEMDEGFLRWILSRDFDGDVRYTAKHWIDSWRRSA